MEGRKIYYAWNKSDKMQRVKKGKIGALVAAKFPGGSVKSAKIIKNDVADEKLIVETAYGRRVTVGYEDVIWLKTNNTDFWPRRVQELLKKSESDKVARGAESMSSHKSRVYVKSKQ